MKTSLLLLIFWIPLALSAVGLPVVYNVRDYGATGQKSDDATGAIISTLDKPLGNIRIANFQVFMNPEPGWQSGLMLNKVSSFQLRRVSARQSHKAASLPAISLTDCQHGIISECMAQPGTDTYLHIGGATTRNVVLHTNYLKNARISLFSAKTLYKNTITYTPFP